MVDFFIRSYLNDSNYFNKSDSTRKNDNIFYHDRRVVFLNPSKSFFYLSELFIL